MLPELILFILGAVIGSFLNVCIYRLPQKISLWKPASFCPNCKKPVPVWSNIPVFGFFIVKGKCVYCKNPISLQYIGVEIFSGLLTVLAYKYFALSNLFILYSVFMYFLIVIGLIDLKIQLIYNKVLLVLLSFAVVFQIFWPFTSWPDALTGLAVGSGTMFLISLLGKLLFKKESLGMGDVKLAAVAGFIVGWQFVLIAIYAGFVFALITMILLNRIKGTQLSGYIPLGPFLALGIMVFLFWGNQIIEVYMSLVT